MFLEKNPQGHVSLPFDWEVYQSFMRSTYSAKFVLFPPGMSWVIRADPDLTVWGCGGEFFSGFVSYLGDEATAYRVQYEEFDMSVEEKAEFSEFLDSVFFGARRDA